MVSKAGSYSKSRKVNVLVKLALKMNKKNRELVVLSVAYRSRRNALTGTQNAEFNRIMMTLR